MLIESTLLFVQLVAAQDIGLALTRGPGDACVAMSAAPGSVVTLVSTSSPQTTVTAIVEESSASCILKERTGGAGPYVRLRPRAPVPEYLTVWVAFKGELASKGMRGGRVALRLSAAYPAVQVHDCTSSEGVHYTVWTGEPLTSRPLWHKYYYLGYDTEPSCKVKSEVADL